jgi:hypothetical protein
MFFFLCGKKEHTLDVRVAQVFALDWLFSPGGAKNNQQKS